MRNTLTNVFVRTDLAGRGVKFKATGHGDFRICVAGEGEAAAYYTDDLQDALETGRAMADHADKRAKAARIAAQEAVTYRLASSPIISAPGIVNWALNGYAFKSDRKRLAKVIADGWNIPAPAAHALLSRKAAFEVQGETVVFTV